ncbi:hypothetical protein R3P38DRAFT_3003999 [Favolaschia claudopus]|uniref:F-box domain-containing protein n=1 Tax=Favolaschia claudopus TaxID=2862362 RepID=A0AAW0AMQ6_9AGAR
MAVLHEESGFTSSSLPTPAEVENIRELARVGALPTGLELSKLQSTMTNAPAEIQHYETEIETLQKEISRLASERTSLESYLNLCRSVLSPVHRLPNEMLADIFDLCVPEELYWISDTITVDDEMNRLAHSHLLQLAQVCSRWHRVAMHTPKLWSLITVDVDYWSPGVSDGVNSILANLLESSLARGQDFPLTLNIGIADSISPNGEAIGEMVLQHAHRWREVYIWSRGAPNMALSSATIKLDQLVKLDLNVELWKDVQVFRSTPALTDFSFSGYLDNQPTVPWTQLKTITYDSHNSPGPSYSPLSVLQLAPNVLKCTFYLNLHHESPGHEPWDLQVSSGMKKFYLRLLSSTTGDAVVGHLFDCLTLSALEGLDIYPSDIKLPPVWSSSSFLALADRSGFGSRLTYLAIHVILTDEELLCCLRVLARLEKLFVTDCGTSINTVTITNHFLRELGFGLRTSLIPELKLLSLRCGLEFDDAVYADMLASRVADGTRTRAFKSNLWWFETHKREISPEALGRIAQLVSDGRLIYKSGNPVDLFTFVFRLSSYKCLKPNDIEILSSDPQIHNCAHRVRMTMPNSSPNQYYTTHMDRYVGQLER